MPEKWAKLLGALSNGGIQGAVCFEEFRGQHI
jgi:hypothetical protein